MKTFSDIGGIEKFNRSFAKALQENAKERGWRAMHYSAYDTKADERYFPADKFKGFGKNKWRFALQVCRVAAGQNIVFVGHINLAPVALLMRLVNPKLKLVLLAHGVEVWRPLNSLQQKLLHSCNSIWAVSNFTIKQILTNHAVSPRYFNLFPNTLDVFFAAQSQTEAAAQVRQKYGIPASGKVLLTVARLSTSESRKGYDHVLSVMQSLCKIYPAIHYILAGRSDENEENRLTKLIASLHLQDQVIRPGFIADEDLPSLYAAADAFVMPSGKEGFGIVFLEAAWWGLPIVAGNADGSVEALLNGALGSLVEPGNTAELEAAILQVLQQSPPYDKQAQNRALIDTHFGFDKFKKSQELAIGRLELSGA